MKNSANTARRFLGKEQHRSSKFEPDTIVWASRGAELVGTLYTVRDKASHGRKQEVDGFSGVLGGGRGKFKMGQRTSNEQITDPHL